RLPALHPQPSTLSLGRGVDRRVLGDDPHERAPGMSAAARTHPLGDVDLVARVRRATQMGAAVWALFFAFTLFTHVALLTSPAGRAVAALVAAAVGLNATFAVLAGTWARWRPAVYVYETMNAVLITLVLGTIGGQLEAGFGLVAYGFLVIHTWEVRPDSSA